MRPNASAIATVDFVERHAPSRPYRLGTRRRRAPKAHAHTEAGGTCSSREAGTPSLDTEKQLATTVRDWSAEQETEADRYRAQFLLHRQLTSTVHEIWQRLRRKGEERFAAAAKWEKQWLNLNNCQMQWVGYKAACCGPRSRAIAVPIGCNHRLCPHCAFSRSKKARVRIKKMFDRLTHPAMLTFTIPNLESVSKHDYTLLRQRVRKFISQHKEMILGGVYSIETTRNRRDKTWHIHAHALVDLSRALPTKQERVVLAGKRVFAFTALKLRMEFDWMRLTTGGWGKAKRKDCCYEERRGDTQTFESWVKQGRLNSVKVFDPFSRRYVTDPELSEAEVARRMEWNRKNRRVFDVRPVIDRDGAAREVLKYITKVADFGDDPDAVEQFCNATRGARLIQTFGSWYGFNVDADFDPEHMDDWTQMECSCGLNMWERIGVFFAHDVRMDESGRWHLKPDININAGGTVPRPTIRALDGPGKDAFSHGDDSSYIPQQNGGERETEAAIYTAFRTAGSFEAR